MAGLGRMVQRLTLALMVVCLTIVCSASFLRAEPLPAIVTIIDPEYIDLGETAAESEDNGVPLSAPTANAFPSAVQLTVPTPAPREPLGVAPRAVNVPVARPALVASPALVARPALDANPAPDVKATLQFTSPVESAASASASYSASPSSTSVRRQYRTPPSASPSVPPSKPTQTAPRKNQPTNSSQTALVMRRPVPSSTSVQNQDRLVRVLLYWGSGPVKVSSSGGGVMLNGKRYPVADVTVSTSSVNKHWHLTPAAGLLQFKGLEYRGSLEVYPVNGKLQIVNVLPLEDYLRGVVPKELMAREIEAMKAQAILARTYAVSTAAKANKNSYWELRDDTGHQVYGGASAEQPLADEAVRQTKNQVLTYRKELCVAVLYHSTCGGYTDSNANVFGTVPVPYLKPVTCGERATEAHARGLGLSGSLASNVSDAAHQFRYASGGTKAWCQGSSFARWEACWSPEELGQEVGRRTGKSTGSVVSVNVLERTVSGRVKRLEMRFSNGATEVLGGDNLRNTLCYRNASGAWCSLPSTRFEVAEVSKKVVRLRGCGWGHGVGMCQWGAKAMAQRGCKAQEILQHYYAGTEIVSLDGLNVGR